VADAMIKANQPAVNLPAAAPRWYKPRHDILYASASLS